MPGFGFGFGANFASRQFATLSPDAGVIALAPSGSWTGVAASGFASVPVDPARSTAKPACRLLVPPRQWFTDEIVVGVSAAANNNGSLLDNLGLEKVIVHWEGSIHEITSPSYYLLEDANGVPRKYLGWWIVLQKPVSTAGHAHVYFEAVPKDATMQSRVIGPYQFSPQDALHDATIEVDATPAEITGERYKTVSAAINYAREQSLENPLIQVTGPEDQLLPRGNYNYKLPNGWVTVEGTVPFKFHQSLDYTYDPTNILFSFRPRVWGMHFRGENVTFDFANVPGYYSESASGGDGNIWIDGVNVINSKGRYRLYRGGPADQAGLWRGHPWITECNMSEVAYGASAASLVRGGTFTGMVSDLFDDSICVIGTTTEDLSSVEFTTDVDAFVVQYTGGAGAATAQLSGGVGNTRVLTLKEDGASVGSFTIQSNASAWAGDTNYTVQNVVDWINSLTGWTAILHDNDRAAAWLGVSGGKGNAFAATDAKSAPLTLFTNIAVHVDWWQLRDGSWADENVIITNNIGTNLNAQILFLASQNVDPKDFLIYNNALGAVGVLGGFSQLGKNADHSHVVLAHNSLVRQGISLRTDQGYNPDGYCLLANNALQALEWSGAPDANLVIAHNHLPAGGFDLAGAIGTTIGGAEASLFGNAAAGDFTPAGELLSNLKLPVVKFDRNGNDRGYAAAAGAVKN